MCRSALRDVRFSHVWPTMWHIIIFQNGFDATGFYNSFHSLILTGSIIHYLATKSQIGFASYTYIE